jgi:hypothetical protein
MNNNRLSFPNGFEKTEVRWEKIKIKLAPNYEIDVIRIYIQIRQIDTTRR